MPKTVAIIQARMSATRLPGKILLKLGDKSVLAHVVRRVRRCKYIDDVVVATTTLPADDATIEECKKNGVKYFRGSSENVLQRYYQAACEAKADIVIRITSDCPFIDPEILSAMLIQFKNENVDYLSNTLTRTYPRGFDIEIFKFTALEKTYRDAIAPFEQEHVTPYIYLNADKFFLLYFSDNDDNSDLRVTLDTEEDWQVIKLVYEALEKNNADFSYIDVVNYLRQNPDIAKINMHIEQKKIGE